MSIIKSRKVRELFPSRKVRSYSSLCSSVLCCTDWRRRRMFTRVGQRLHLDDARSGGGRSCPSPVRCLMQLVRYGHRHRTQDVDSRQPGDDVGMTEPGERSSCCRCMDGSGAGGGGGMMAFVEACAASSAVDRCRLPRCKWWKSLCTRVYLIAINLASFVSSNCAVFFSEHRRRLHRGSGKFAPVPAKQPGKTWIFAPVECK